MPVEYITICLSLESLCRAHIPIKIRPSINLDLTSVFLSILYLNASDKYFKSYLKLYCMVSFNILKSNKSYIICS